MPDAMRDARQIVMLTADRRIDRRILLEADSLEEAGWDVTILAMPLDPGANDTDPRVVRIGSLNQLVIRENLVLHLYRSIRQLLPMDSWLMRKLKALAWTYIVDQESFYAKLFLPATKKYSPAIFMAHDLPMLPVAFHAARRCGAKLVYDSHELYSEQEFSVREKRRWAAIEDKYIGACDGIITVNASIAGELKRRYGVDDIRVVHNAERLPASLPHERLFHKAFGLPPGAKILLFQGGFSAGRNLGPLIEAMRSVKNPAVHLVLLGDGQYRGALEKKAQRLGVAQRVRFHAAVPQKDLLAYTASADVGVIPYQAICLNNYYCTPNKLFEFIVTGLPVLASDLPEINRIVAGHRIGLVGDMSSSAKMAALIDEVFDSENRLAEWRKNTMLAARFINWDEEGKKVVELFAPFYEPDIRERQAYR